MRPTSHSCSSSTARDDPAPPAPHRAPPAAAGGRCCRLPAPRTRHPPPEAGSRRCRLPASPVPARRERSMRPTSHSRPSLAPRDAAAQFGMAGVGGRCGAGSRHRRLPTPHPAFTGRRGLPAVGGRSRRLPVPPRPPPLGLWPAFRRKSTSPTSYSCSSSTAGAAAASLGATRVGGRCGAGSRLCRLPAPFLASAGRLGLPVVGSRSRRLSVPPSPPPACGLPALGSRSGRPSTPRVVRLSLSRGRRSGKSTWPTSHAGLGRFSRCRRGPGTGGRCRRLPTPGPTGAPASPGWRGG